MASKCLLSCKQLASHEIVIDFYLAIFSRGNHKLVVGRHSEVGTFLVCDAELVSDGFNLSHQRIIPHKLQFAGVSHDQKIATIRSEQDFSNNLPRKVYLPP